LAGTCESDGARKTTEACRHVPGRKRGAHGQRNFACAFISKAMQAAVQRIVDWCGNAMRCGTVRTARCAAVESANDRGLDRQKSFATSPLGLTSQRTFCVSIASQVRVDQLARCVNMCRSSAAISFSHHHDAPRQEVTPTHPARDRTPSERSSLCTIPMASSGPATRLRR
jgi:hypothetical protein